MRVCYRFNMCVKVRENVWRVDHLETKAKLASKIFCTKCNTKARNVWHKIDYFVGTYQCAGSLINSAVISFIVLLSEQACSTWRVLHAVRTEHSVLQVPLGRKYGSWPAWMSKPSDERLGCGLSSLWIWSGDLKTIPKKIM